MEVGVKYFIRRPVLAFLLLALLPSCRKTFDEISPAANRKVFIYYAAGFNNLSSSLAADMNDMIPSLPTSDQAGRYKVIVVSHSTSKSLNYSTATRPVIFDFYRDEYGNAVRDTLHVFPEGTTLAQGSTLSSALNFIKERYPAAQYGICMSSHGSGWVPDSYYLNPVYDKQSYVWNSVPRQASDSADPVMREYYGSSPLVKSCFAHYQSDGKDYTAINIPDLAAAIPFKMDYILMDMCLMGGVEVAYELRNVTDKIVFSAMEVMSEGFNYKSLLGHLLYSEQADLEAVAEDTYKMYTDSSCSTPYCTIALVDCTKLSSLESVCSTLIDSLRLQLDALDGSKVQGYFRSGRHFFYDLKDVFAKAGATQEQLAALQEALDGCIIYKAATPKGVLGSFDIKTFCGMSMCIPHVNSDYLNSFYRTLAWNKAVSLVK